MATAYMSKYGMTGEDLMHVAIKNHENGGLNPKAQFGSIPAWMEGRKAAAARKGWPLPTWRNEMDFLRDEAANPVIAWPLRLFDCSPISDGAACLLVVAEERAADFTRKPIYVIGSGQASGAALHDRPELTEIPAARLAAEQAYRMAGLSQQDVRLAEVHDCFTIAEVIATEDLGFFAPGDGYKAAVDGVTARTGARPVNTSGGLKSKGHPVGASGVGQVIEMWKQMRGEAGPRQVPGDVSIGLTHNVGATGSTCVVHLFKRR
jgi:acetyl-CoA C-acetyltransferase